MMPVQHPISGMPGRAAFPSALVDGRDGKVLVGGTLRLV